MTTGQFADIVKKMRAAQKNYFRTKSREWLDQSRKWEVYVDMALELREKKEYKRQNPSLFGDGK